MIKFWLFLICFMSFSHLCANEHKKAEIFTAIEKQNLQDLKAAIAKPDQLHARSKYEITPLIATAKLGWLEGAQVLVASNVDLNSTDFWGWTALMVAASTGNAEITELLLTAGADLELKEKEGLNALMWAAINGEFATVKLLVEHHADLNALSAKKQKAIDYALTNLNRPIYEYLLSQGSKLQASNKKQLAFYLEQMKEVEAESSREPRQQPKQEIAQSQPAKVQAPVERELPKVELLSALPKVADPEADFGSAREDEVFIIARGVWNKDYLPTMQSAAQLVMSGAFDEALPLLLKARKLSGGQSELALFWQGKSQFELKNYGEAYELFKSYEQLVRKPLEKAAALSYQARALCSATSQAEAAKVEQAIGLLGRAIQVSNGRYSPAIVFLSRLLESRNDDKVALTSLRSYLSKALDLKARNQINIELSYLENKNLPENEKRIPPLAMRDIHGKELNLQDYRGKVVLLQFLSLPREKSLVSLPDLIQLDAQHSKEDLVVLIISDGSLEELKEIAQKKALNWPVIEWNRTPEVAEYFRADTVPYSILLNGEGTVLYMDRGWDKQVLKHVNREVEQKKVRHEAHVNAPIATGI